MEMKLLRLRLFLHNLKIKWLENIISMSSNEICFCIAPMWLKTLRMALYNGFPKNK